MRTVKEKIWDNAFLRGMFLGICLYLCVFGAATMNVGYDAFIFIDGRDIPQHYLGWIFFRFAEWNNGIGMFDTLTYPNFISIIYTDSIPLIEVFLKLLSPLLPQTFQYFGIWGFICFALQGGLAALVLDFYTNNKAENVVGTIFIILSTPVLTKLFYHHALGSQFIILLGLYYWLYSARTETRNRKRDLLCWFGIGFLAAGIHMYFLPMAGIIVLGQAVNIWLDDHKVWQHSVLIVLSYIVGAAISFALFGGFSGSFQMDSSYVETATDLFYRCGANLDAFTNSWGIALLGTAHTTARDGQGEGLAYLGVGILLLLMVAVSSLVNERIREGAGKKDIGLLSHKEKNFLYSQIIVAALSIIVAIGPTICWHNQVLFEIPYPNFLIRLWSIFRCEGRFIWVAYYIIISWSLKIFSECRIKKQIKLYILIFCCFLQIIDLAPYLKSRRNLYGHYYTYESELKNDAWELLGEKFDHVVVIPNIILTRGDERYDIAQWAGKNGMTLNDFYLARQNLIDQSSAIEEQILSGNTDKKTIYMFNEEEVYKLGESGLHLYLIDGWYIGTEVDLEPTIKRKEIEKQYIVSKGQISDSYIYEGQNYASVFDPVYYYYSYSDLWENYTADDNDELFEHFISVGMREGRRASNQFNPLKYKARNADVEAVYGEEWQLYYKHYIEFGIAEGRNGN